MKVCGTRKSSHTFVQPWFCGLLHDGLVQVLAACANMVSLQHSQARGQYVICNILRTMADLGAADFLCCKSQRWSAAPAEICLLLPQVWAHQWPYHTAATLDVR